MKYIDERSPEYEAHIERLAERRAEARKDGEPMTAADYDKLEAGPWWGSVPR